VLLGADIRAPLTRVFFVRDSVGIPSLGYTNLSAIEVSITT
jgi:hypothetical protein